METPTPLGRSLILLILFTALAAGGAAAQTAAAPCPDPLAVLRAFYDDNDALRFEESTGLLTDDAQFATWATGANGHIMAERHLKGREQIGAYLAIGRGVARRLPGSPPDGPVYHETRISVVEGTVRFMLEPDRKRPNGRLYNPFSIEAVLDGCRIRSLTVVEQVTWL
jgi:hypothetical protein